MLDTADATLRRAGVRPHVRLAQGLAEDLDLEAQFGLAEPLDVAFFSYTLSMIPTWPDALEAALGVLRPGGCLYVVDFWDQADLPDWFAWLLTRWLALFDVHHRPDLLTRMRALDAEGRVDLTLTPVFHRYAYIARLVKR
jgi:S-adenosylmethionine-diacylgycerolhomoserine-N-methlytransferase